MTRLRSIIGIIVLCLFVVSCNRQHNIYTLEGTIDSGSNDSIIVTGFDYRFERTDTIRPIDGKFVYTVQVDTITPLFLFYTDGSQDIVFAEKDITSTLHKTDSTKFSIINGGKTNNELTTFRNEVESDTTFEQIIARIDTFITHNPFSEAIPYLIYEYMVRQNKASVAQLNSVMNKMSGLLQDHQFILDLNTNKKTVGGSASFISRVTVTDTANIKTQFNQISDHGYQAVCLWASWHEQSYNARKQFYTLQDSFPNKQLMFTTLSIDTNFDRWKDAVSKDSLNLIDYCDQTGWDSKIVTTPGINKLPAYLLLTGQEHITAVCYSIDDLKFTIKDRVPDKDDD